MNIKKLILGFIITSSTLLAHFDSAYWHDTARTQTRSGWMDWLSDDRRLSELSIPGSHDSGAWRSNLLGLDSTRTQSMTIEDQLNSGIRALDIRVKYNKDKFPLYHGVAALGDDFEDVLNITRKFLKENPREVVYIRFKQENSSASDSEMENLFLTYYNRNKDLFYTGGNSNPTVRETRGKIVLIADVLSLVKYGINYRSFKTQDFATVDSNWDLYDKWLKVKDHLNYTQNTTGELSVNYLTANGGSYPYFIASGHVSPGTKADRLSTGLTEPGFSHRYRDFPRVNRLGVFATIAFEGTNTLSADYIEKSKLSRVGIIMADFPGERLINTIIEANKRHHIN